MQLVKSTDQVDLNIKFFRPGKVSRHVANFGITQGGLGDYICYISVLRWIAENFPHIDGRIYAIEWFHELAENVMKPFLDRWRIYPRESLTQDKLKRPTFVPHQFPINRIGANAIDLAFIYYMSMTPAPKDCYYAKLDLTQIESLGEPASPYAVMTPAASNGPKTMTAKAFNGIKDYLLKRGITPMFLGKRDIDAKRKVSVCDDYDFSGGVDLTEQTTLLQAAALISKAKLVIGLDNGLLHLAAMTDVPIIYGYTLSSVEHTKPRRKSGIIHDIFPDPNVLTCTFCQSKMRMMGKIEFARCAYDDNLCTEILGDPTPWCGLIDEVVDAKDFVSIPIGA